MTAIAPVPASNGALVDGEFVLTAKDFSRIAAAAFKDAGIHLPDSKASMVYSRLAKRLRALKIPSFEDYCDHIEGPDGKEERHEMLASLTTNVTSFFREPHHFEHLKNEVMPDLVRLAKSGGRVRLWSAACSNGSEPYSMALMVLSQLPDAANYDVKILATDIDPKILQKARKGLYPARDTEAIPSDLRQRYFEETTNDFGEACYVAGDELKKLITFKELNLNGSWPMSGKFQAIFCRNVVIYFQMETQQEVWLRFAGQLLNEGWLYIGHSERVTGRAADLFATEGITTYRFFDERS